MGCTGALLLAWALGCTPETAAGASALVASDDTEPPDPGTPSGSEPTTEPSTTPSTPSTDTSSTTPTATECFGDFLHPGVPSPDYDQFGPVVGSHCSGTNHQNITGVERVVFLGDSITVGTPPTLAVDYYRNQLAHELASRFGLEPPGSLWETVDLINGTSLVQRSGDFWSCSEWGARADDLIQSSTQIDDCFPPGERDRTTLVIMTIGGNDLAALQEDLAQGVPIPDLWDQTESFMGLIRDAVAYLADPVAFPGGNYVIMTNLYEFTDGTGILSSCPAADLLGYSDSPDPELFEMVVWAMEEYISISVDHQTDVLFLLEAFCGHGYMRDDPTSPCYRGPAAELWFDLTCIHPNPAGHTAIAELFRDVILE